MHIVIVGGGVIGLATAWRALAQGLAVTVVDPEPASRASYASAGMLPPANEQLYDDEPLRRLYLASRDRYPSFVAELEEVSGRSTGHRRDGVLDVALDTVAVADLDRAHRFHKAHGIRTEALTAEECRAYEPRFAPSVRGGLLAPDDGAVDPRRLTAALLAAIERLGGTLVTDRVTDVLIEGRATGVRLAGGGTVTGDRTVLAAGCWTHLLGGLPPGVVPQIRPVKGQILRLRSDGPFLHRTTRGLVGGSAVYLVPRADGELVVGATYEEHGYDTTVTAGGLAELLGKARAVLPEVTGLAFAEVSAALRPGSPDDRPLIGATSVPDLLLATGHFRIGVQLCAVTADALAAVLSGGELPEAARPFSPVRGDGAGAD
ncbi:glycine oxidase ThiO [Streptomyces sp. NPDC057621]|uniref:glycine oxidase ThiO n=1 Tax=Streptomyces sp. NPDC057621 TaxID=3346186 RepID=UPI0036D09F55